jgi:hypothetical protein
VIFKKFFLQKNNTNLNSGNDIKEPELEASHAQIKSKIIFKLNIFNKKNLLYIKLTQNI